VHPLAIEVDWGLLQIEQWQGGIQLELVCVKLGMTMRRTGICLRGGGENLSSNIAAEWAMI